MTTALLYWDGPAVAVNSMPHMPPIVRGSEAHEASRRGCAGLKVFIATSLGTSLTTSMRGPFRVARCAASGGMNERNTGAFLAAGAAGVSFGAGFVRLIADDLAVLT